MNPRPRVHLFRRLLRLHLAHGFIPWRWLVLPLGLLVLFPRRVHETQHNYFRHGPRESNLWDLFPLLLAERPGLLWGLALGFTLMVGDALVRARSSGSAALALSHVPSRTSWWATRLGAMGLGAAAYVVVFTTTTLLVAAFTLPLSLEPSPTATTQVFEDMLYPRWPDMPMPLFTLVIAAHAALGLWLLGALIELASLFSRHPLVPLLGAIGWMVLCVPGLAHLWEGAVRWLDLARVLSYTTLLDPQGLTVPAFLLGWGAVMAAIFFAGAWRLRRMDIV